jgi:histidyl-tRNA synthetase
MSKTKLQSPTGMHDILPADQKYFSKIYEVVSKIADFYGFQKIDTPIMEYSDVFEKGTGPSTDIVEKEMYSFKTKGGDSLTLRPEGTPAIVRSFIENGMTSWSQPVRLWYWGPFFRHERPQADRYRQFHQFGFEVFGENESIIDAQIIQIFYNIFQELKIKDLSIEVNSIGDSQCKPYYKKLLSNYLKTRSSSLCADCKKRINENVLRVLDCKEEKCQPIKTDAPQIIDHLCEECKTHFKEVLEFLEEIEIPYNLNPYLVRGLDYYTKTVFEIFSKREGEENSSVALAGGGRYDKLVKFLGGRDTPACGGAAGIERIVKIMKDKGEIADKEQEFQIFLAQLGNMAKRKSLKLMEEFRKANIKTAESLGRDSLKAQLGRADHLKVKYALIIGQQEALNNVVIIRNMENGKQETVKLEKAVEEVKKSLKK